MLSRYLFSLSIPIFLVVALYSPLLSQAQSQMSYWTKAAPPTVARQELYPEVLNGKIYVAGGLLTPNTRFSDHFESYDPVKDAWTQLRSLPEARHHITLSAINGLLYGVGGFTGGFPDWRAQTTMFVYNPGSNTWTKGTDLPVARAEGVSAVVDDIDILNRRAHSSH
ncbi:MAG TPA: kelch repeat-containing protein [Coleofasciculaceae cyanobacterium]|jgi:N-acetylneuraminic acid mutarotase